MSLAIVRRIATTVFTGGLVLTVCPQRVEAAPCSATAAGAVLQSMGMAAPSVGSGGFRVRAVLPDAALGRAFVQVESCDHPEYPAVSLPLGMLAAMPHGAAPAAGVAAQSAGAVDAAADVPKGSAVAIRSVDAHVNMQMQGRLLQASAIGRVVEVEIAALTGDGEAKHLRGRLVAADRVEVQP